MPDSAPGVNAPDQPLQELFDVVNDLDEPIDCLPRAIVHQQGLKHRAVHVLAFNSKGEVFLQKRSMTKDCFPGKWDSSASGHVDSGEAYDACAVRELGEELGVTQAPPLKKLFKIDACAGTGQEFVWVYRCRLEGPFKLDASEIDEGGWFNTQDVNEWIFRQPGDFASGFLLLWKILQPE